MSIHANIRYKIDKLFEKDGSEKIDKIESFVGILQSNQGEASRNVRRYFIWLVLVWVTALAISQGLVTEGGEILSFKISDVSIFLIISPVVISCLYYLLTLSYASDLYLSIAIAECYKRILPTAYDYQLHLLVSLPTFFNMERYFTDNISVNLTNNLVALWTMLMVMIIFLLPLGAIAQTAYLMMITDINWFIQWSILIVSLLFVVKGILNIAVAYKVTKHA